MKIRYLLIVFSIFVISTSVVNAQESSSPGGVVTPDVVSQQCSLSQSYLNRTLKPRDLKSRVDRLQAYRYIFQRLDIYVSRLERNNQSGAKELRANLDDLKNKTEQFKNLYETYDATRELSAKYQECEKSPEQFLKNIDATRVERQNVNAKIIEIQNLLDQTIKKQLENLYQNQLEAEKLAGN